MNVAIIIPARNEEQNLPKVFPRLPQMPEIAEVILVDGHSTDNTVRVAKELLPQVSVVTQERSGKGDAILCGARAARGDYFLVLDADGSQRPEEIPLYVQKAREGYDLVKGSRWMKGGCSEEDTWDRKLTTKTAQLVANILWRTSFTDICYGMFLINREKFLDLGIRSLRHDIEWELMIKAARNGFNIVEVPAYEAKRFSGRSHLSYGKDGWLIAKAVFREFFRGLLGRK